MASVAVTVRERVGGGEGDGWRGREEERDMEGERGYDLHK